jgi:hypothetical protein
VTRQTLRLGASSRLVGGSSSGVVIASIAGAFTGHVRHRETGSGGRREPTWGRLELAK